jgi:transcription initiation factor TFIIIB Brf1 subunit/transcription initiation factor TFIIB
MKSQIDIANAADITEVTIRNRFKDIKNRLELDEYTDDSHLF